MVLKNNIRQLAEGSWEGKDLKTDEPALRIYTANWKMLGFKGWKVVDLQMAFKNFDLISKSVFW
jgi:hypothetical protein